MSQLNTAPLLLLGSRLVTADLLEGTDRCSSHLDQDQTALCLTNAAAERALRADSAASAGRVRPKTMKDEQLQALPAHRARVSAQYGAQKLRP
jgi:hypothetical protein